MKKTKENIVLTIKKGFIYGGEGWGIYEGEQFICAGLSWDFARERLMGIWFWHNRLNDNGDYIKKGVNETRNSNELLKIMALKVGEECEFHI
jgi:hypothetical protein